MLVCLVIDTFAQADNAIQTSSIERECLAHHMGNGMLNIETNMGLVQIEAYSEKVMEIRSFPGMLPEIDSSLSIKQKRTAPSITVSEQPEYLIFKTDSLTILIGKSPFYLSFIYGQDTLLKGYFENNVKQKKNGVQFKIDDHELFYGLGAQKEFPLKRTIYTFKNKIPDLLSSKGYMLCFQNTGNSTISFDNNSLKQESDTKSLQYFFIASAGVKELLSGWYNLTGSKTILPRKIMIDNRENSWPVEGYKTRVSWGNIDSLLPVLFNLGLSGTPYAYTDVSIANDEGLINRYMQLTSLNPVFKYPEIINHEGEIIRLFYKNKLLRYRLMPLLSTFSAQTALKGYPMIRPLFFEFPGDEESYGITDEFMLGNSILAAPVLTKRKHTRTVYLPGRERWYFFWSNRKYRGGNEYDIPVTPDKLPLFVRGGTFLPLADTATMNQQYTTKNLTIRYYVNRKSASDTYLMYEDAGNDPQALADGNFETLMFLQKRDVRDNLSFMFSRINKGYQGMPEMRNIRLEIIGQTDVKKMRFFKNDVELKKKKPGKNKEGFYFDKTRRVWVVEFGWENDEVIITTKRM